MLSSVSTGANADLIATLFGFYIPDGALVADVTYGKGAFWKKKTDAHKFTLIGSDLSLRLAPDCAADFTALPYRTNSLDIVVLDPPYMHNPGKHMTDSRYNNVATTAGMYHKDIIALYVRGMAEAVRALRPKGRLLVKCKDEIESNTQCWSHIELLNEASKLGLYGKDLFILVPDSRTSPNRWKQQLHARKHHSYLWVFESR